MKKLVLFSTLATFLLAVPAVQAQNWRGQRLENRGAALERRGAWLEQHGKPRLGERLERRGQRLENLGERREHRGYYQHYGPREWARGPNYGPMRPQGWANNQPRPFYQGRPNGNFRPPYGPANYGPGYNRPPQAAYGPGGRPYNFGQPPAAYGPGPGAHNNPMPAMAPGNGSVTPIAYHPTPGYTNPSSGGWANHTPGTTSQSNWRDHFNSGTPSGTGPNGPGGPTTPSH